MIKHHLRWLTTTTSSRNQPVERLGNKNENNKSQNIYTTRSTKEVASCLRELLKREARPFSWKNIKLLLDKLNLFHKLETGNPPRADIVSCLEFLSKSIEAGIGSSTGTSCKESLVLYIRYLRLVSIQLGGSYFRKVLANQSQSVNSFLERVFPLIKTDLCGNLNSCRILLKAYSHFSYQNNIICGYVADELLDSVKKPNSLPEVDKTAIIACSVTSLAQLRYCDYQLQHHLDEWNSSLRQSARIPIIAVELLRRIKPSEIRLLSVNSLSLLGHSLVFLDDQRDSELRYQIVQKISKAVASSDFLSSCNPSQLSFLLVGMYSSGVGSAACSVLRSHLQNIKSDRDAQTISCSVFKSFLKVSMRDNSPEILSVLRSCVDYLESVFSNNKLSQETLGMLVQSWSSIKISSGKVPRFVDSFIRNILDSNYIGMITTTTPSSLASVIIAHGVSRCGNGNLISTLALSILISHGVVSRHPLHHPNVIATMKYLNYYNLPPVAELIELDVNFGFEVLSQSIPPPTVPPIPKNEFT